ncbi:MAG: hypothetical protein JW787_02925 [Sedimentisphaerales bacterium]|nr:hypothetical protein [Sedimentisphaerales bacterium]
MTSQICYIWKKHTIQLIVIFSILQGFSGCVNTTIQKQEIGGILYDHIDPGRRFMEASRPKQNWKAPNPYEAEAKAGMIAYITSDAGDYKPYRIPKPEEHTSKLTVFIAKGETKARWIGVYGLADLHALSAKVDLKNAPLSVDVRHIHFWPQRTSWKSRKWYMTGELLLPCANGTKMVPVQYGVLEQKSFDVKQNKTAAFWFTLSTDENATPGTYDCTVTITSEDKPSLLLPLQIDVLPFRLEKPKDKQWMLYEDSARWNTMSDAQIIAELEDFKKHGITGFITMPLGDPDLSQLKTTGKVSFNAEAFKQLAKLCNEAGIPGPHVCICVNLPERVRDALGLKNNLKEGKWPQAVIDGVTEVARAAVEATKDTPVRWYYYGVDEPRVDNTYAIQEYQAWHNGGAQTYTSFGDPKFLEKAAEYLTAPCFNTYLIGSQAGTKLALQSCTNTGAEFWWYGIGSYVNPHPQECSTFYNRYGAGCLLWKTGAKSVVAWTFCRVHEDPFNDFDGLQDNSIEPKDQVTAYPEFLKPNDWYTYQGAIPTLAWEGIREGVNDYRYLATLSSLIAQAQESKQISTTDAASRVQVTLNTLIDSIPWINPMEQSNFKTNQLQELQRAVADQIMLLLGVLNDEALMERN